MGQIKTFLQDIQGIAAVEFTLIAPFIITMLVGVADFGIYIHEKMNMDSTTRAVAQYLMHGGEADFVETDILDNAPIELSSNEWTLEDIYECENGVATTSDGDCGDGDYRRHFVSITITKEYDSIMPFGDLPVDIELSSSVKIQVADG